MALLIPADARGFFRVHLLDQSLVGSSRFSQFDACRQRAWDWFGREPAEQIKYVAGCPAELFKAGVASNQHPRRVVHHSCVMPSANLLLARADGRPRFHLGLNYNLVRCLEMEALADDFAK